MPGILPMKVIKIGVNAQTRIAQACDRCRSKKIRCDGVRPTCSQCANVGFECKTSDKLSRRAFPRGYTESLEERVRGLEAEVRELKDLLDEKDEKIDLLSRLHSRSSQPIPAQPLRRPSAESASSNRATESTTDQDEHFKVQQSPYLHKDEGTDSYFTGASSVGTFVEAFKHKVQEQGRSTEDIDARKLLSSSHKPSDHEAGVSDEPPAFKAPPRLVSDKLVNVFFQEWAPLFPVLHRPTFLTLYEKYVADPDTVTNQAEIAQLNLVFGIASLSSGARSSEDLQSFEAQWKAAIDTVLTETSMSSLQALVLAQIYCLQKSDVTRLLSYTGLSTIVSARLGLHQSQKRFALGALTCETRKKVFWTLYSVDCFTAVVLGLQRQFKDDDIQCEYPVDADDENVTEQGFQASLPGESTKLSSALALFKAARILSTVLTEVYPATSSYDLSLNKLAKLSDELDAWTSSLPPHLRLQFAQDKPSTGIISSRSPLLSLTYHYIRALIHRPVICASLGPQSTSPSMLKLASSCKHMVQIMRLLDERGMSFSFCLNRDELLVFCGIGVLFQGITLDRDSRILKDNSKTLSTILETLDKSSAPCASELRRAVISFGPALPHAPGSKHDMPMLSRHNSDSAVVVVGEQSRGDQSPRSAAKKQLKAIASCFSSSHTSKPSFDVSDHRRASVHNISLHPYGAPTRSQPSLQPAAYDPAATSRSEPARSPINMFSRPNSIAVLPTPSPPMPAVVPRQRQQRPPLRLTNLDYLSFEPDNSAAPARTSAAGPVKPEHVPTEWEKLLGNLDNGTTNIYDATYGGPPVEALLDVHSGIAGQPTTTSSQRQRQQRDSSSTDLAWDPELWTLCPSDTSATSAHSAFFSGRGPPDSVLSLSSDEGGISGGGEHKHRSISSGSGGGDEFSSFSMPDWASGVGGPMKSGDAYRAIVMPEMSHADDMPFASSWEAGLSL